MISPEHSALSISNAETMNLNALRLSARRGNLETELLLQAFVEHLAQQEPSSAQTLHNLSQLLQADDQSLFDWLVKQTQVPPHFETLVHEIRENYLNSTK